MSSTISLPDAFVISPDTAKIQRISGDSRQTDDDSEVGGGDIQRGRLSKAHGEAKSVSAGSVED